MSPAQRTLTLADLSRVEAAADLDNPAVMGFVAVTNWICNKPFEHVCWRHERHHLDRTHRTVSSPKSPNSRSKACGRDRSGVLSLTLPYTAFGQPAPTEVNERRMLDEIALG